MCGRILGDEDVKAYLLELWLRWRHLENILTGVSGVIEVVVVVATQCSRQVRGGIAFRISSAWPVHKSAWLLYRTQTVKTTYSPPR
jgi:hypothetical protein